MDIDVFSRMPESQLENCSVVQDFAEYSNTPLWKVVKRIKNTHALSVREFNGMVSKHGDKRTAEIDFYENTSSYVYDLLANQASYEGVCNKLLKFLGPVLSEMKGTGSKFMDFGAGCGVLCHIMAEWGEKEVTHVDVQSDILEFARWRYKKYGVTVNVHPIPQDHFILPETYDTIFTDAVWEHITPTQQIEYAEYLARMINPGGMFVMIIDLAGITDTEPMHYPVNVVAVHDALEAAGLTCKLGRNSFASMWRNIK